MSEVPPIRNRHTFNIWGAFDHAQVSRPEGERPLWNVRINELIFGVLFLVGEIVDLLRWLRRLG
jgi:hypothetical protein